MAHIRHLERKTKAVLRKVWGLGERKLGENWEKRLKLFEAISQERHEIWGWKEKEESLRRFKIDI